MRKLVKIKAMKGSFLTFFFIGELVLECGRIGARSGSGLDLSADILNLRVNFACLLVELHECINGTHFKASFLDLKNVR